MTFKPGATEPIVVGSIFRLGPGQFSFAKVDSMLATDWQGTLTFAGHLPSLPAKLPGMLATSMLIFRPGSAPKKNHPRSNNFRNALL